MNKYFEPWDRRHYYYGSVNELKNVEWDVDKPMPTTKIEKIVAGMIIGIVLVLWMLK